MTPNEIEVLIHCHVVPARHPRFDAPAVKDALQRLYNKGYIKQVAADQFNTTPKGDELITKLRKVASL
jgi:Mn-dependent DtxR family transcriptional regulator